MTTTSPAEPNVDVAAAAVAAGLTFSVARGICTPVVHTLSDGDGRVVAVWHLHTGWVAMGRSEPIRRGQSS